MTTLFGQGLRWPYQVGGSGRLRLLAGIDRLLDSVEQVLSTPKGTCPLDPRYGVDLDAYDVVSQLDQLAWAVADAIEYAEPRAGRIEVDIVGSDPEQGIVSLSITITPIDSNVPVNRVYPLYVGDS